MVKHDISVQGIGLNGVAHSKPVLLQMNDDDFPNAFLRDLSVMPPPPPPTGTPNGNAAAAAMPLSSTQALATSPNVPVTLYQPVTRVTHLALVQLSCESPGFPRLDPKRVQSAGLVIRQVPTAGSSPAAALQWMKNSNGQFGWMQPSQPNADPDPTRRPQLQSGQPALNELLAAQALASAMMESATPAFVAAPNICNAAQRTLVYALIPTASSEASTLRPPSVPPLSPAAISPILTTLLRAGKHRAPHAGKRVTYLYMSDEYAKANNATHFTIFSSTLRLLYAAFGAFDSSNPLAVNLLNVLNRHNVTIATESGSKLKPMGDFYQEAATKLIDYDVNSDPGPAPELTMPDAWDFFSKAAEQELLDAMVPLLQSQGNAAAAPQGRFQDATKLYRARLFFRIKSENSSCPPQLVWSGYTDPFRIAAWYESSGRAVAPVPLPDPFDKNVLKNAKKTSAFAVPPTLMNAMNGASLSALSSGSAPPSGGGLGVTWICSFSIPLITICAFFVLNIFLSLLNIVFFWMAFIKICIPVPKD
jgi:hypothetical protein